MQIKIIIVINHSDCRGEDLMINPQPRQETYIGTYYLYVQSHIST